MNRINENQANHSNSDNDVKNLNKLTSIILKLIGVI